MGGLPRDWGHARDYVRMQWLMLQQDTPEDYVIATGQQYTVRQFITWAAEDLGITLRFEGEGLEEVGVVEAVKAPAAGAAGPADQATAQAAGQGGLAGDDAAHAVKPGDIIVRIDSRYFRPAEVETLLGDPSKAKRELGWTPEITARRMCTEMIEEDLRIAQRHALLKAHGLEVPVSVET